MRKATLQVYAEWDTVGAAASKGFSTLYDQGKEQQWSLLARKSSLENEERAAEKHNLLCYQNCVFRPEARLVSFSLYKP